MDRSGDRGKKTSVISDDGEQWISSVAVDLRHKQTCADVTL